MVDVVIQFINKSSNITAIATVKEIDDSDILIEFDNYVEIEVNIIIEVNGSLELEIE
ncbi:MULTISPECIES: hypothetical protein [unclassified Clostridium]|uniref:hypothetical protein n=1 Tax=unclassified Clostridium TaxID=2614128 RepID=UPI0025C4A332|nr:MULTISPECIES: hypothetical protein [unclassified Clostridium]